MHTCTRAYVQCIPIIPGQSSAAEAIDGAAVLRRVLVAYKIARLPSHLPSVLPPQIPQDLSRVTTYYKSYIQHHGFIFS